MLETLNDHIALYFGSGRPVQEACGSMGAIHEKQVRETSGCQAQVSANAVFPAIIERRTIGAANIDAQDAAGDRIEAGAEDKNIELVLRPVVHDHRRRCDVVDGVLANVHQCDVSLVEDLVVAVFQARPLGAKWIGCGVGSHLTGDFRVVDARTRLVPPEGVRRVVGLLV
ncbi:hypothetical protein D3C72_1516810 [compost metagenome]